MDAFARSRCALWSGGQIGDLHGLNTGRHQPTKLAAMEGLWQTGRGVPSTLFAWPDMEAEANRWAVEVPRLGSLYLTHSWDGKVQGLTAVPREERPYVPLVFFAFRVMVGIGLVLLGMAVVGAVLRWRGRLFEARGFHLLCMLVAPLGFVAVLAGWTVTETGRQPFVVYGLLRTADAVSPLAAGAVSASLATFLALYAVLFVAFLWFGVRLVRAGPAAPAADIVDTGHFAQPVPDAAAPAPRPAAAHRVPGE